MKFKTILAISAMFVSTISMAQFSTGVYIGLAPGKALSINSNYISDVMNEAEYGLTPLSQGLTYVGGLSAQYTFQNDFFVGANLEYQNTSVEYALWNVSGASEDRPSMTVSETEHRIAVPIYLGVRLGNFNVSSGISVNAMLSKSSGFEQFDSFNNSASKLFMGWNASLAYDFGPVEAGMRYMQDFTNYGSGYQLAGEDMEFYGNTNRFVFFVKYNIKRRG